MSEDTKTTPVVPAATDNEAKVGNVTPQDSKPEITPEIQKVIDGAIESRLKREAEKQAKERSELEAKYKAEAEERERLAKLSEEERQAELRKKYESELNEKARNLKIAQNKLDFTKKFEEDQIPTGLMDFITDEDEAKMAERYEVLKSTWGEELNKKLESRLKPTTSLPKFQSNSPRSTLKSAY